MSLVVKAKTDRGLRRESNQDSFACWIPEDPGERDRKGVLLVVADGMGGARGGDVASRGAVDTLVRVYREAADSNVGQALARAVQQANQSVHEQSLADPDLAGMGTTCTAAVVRNGDIFLAHVGDSRAYLVTSAGIRQLTRDHSLVAHLVEQQTLTPEEARIDPRRNLVTRSLGLGPEVEIDTVALTAGLGRGDTLLLCSDGLHGAITDQELQHAVAGRELEVACRDLVALANQAGGPDNITVILARLDEERGKSGNPEPRGAIAANPGGASSAERESRERPGLARHRRRIPIPGWLIIASAVLLLLLVFSVLAVMLENAAGRS